MQIYIGTDHGGYTHKQKLLSYLSSAGYGVKDCGAFSLDPGDDYPAYARIVCSSLKKDSDRGILLCRSGQGMAMAANRYTHIRAALVWSKELALETRRDNDANVLVLPADFIAGDQIESIVETFLSTPFSGLDRHARRIAQLN